VNRRPWVRVFTRATGVSPRAFAQACRLARFRDGLRKGRVLDALADAGFGSTSRAHGALGMTPGAYRRRGAGEEIRYATARTPLGPLLVASTSRGLCAVSLGGTPADLAREFPRARIRKDAGGLRAAVAALLKHLDGRLPRLELPTDARATAFQARVWEELRRIPYGRTATYAQIAQAVGAPRATRAVARAIASNRLALVVPCHRVVRSDGELGGYRWGTSRKRRLLEREGAR
jgi:AraC family transcriptional regulator of adaptative response/methylated-DNA-[protein]-cysteine methyltransferase